MLAITGGRLLEGHDPAAPFATILVTDGRIADVLPPDAPLPESAERFDASGRLVIPGLVNAHTHGHGNLMKGVADRWTLELSLANGPWVSGSRDPEQKYLSALAGAAE